MVRQKKSHPQKIDNKNLQVCQLEVCRLVGKKIFILQIIKVCDGNPPKYLQVYLEPDSEEVLNYKRTYYKYFLSI